MRVRSIMNVLFGIVALSLLVASTSLLTIAETAAPAVGEADAVQRFNSALRPLQALHRDLDKHPPGYLTDPGRLLDSVAVLRDTLERLREISRDLPIAETTKACLGYVLDTSAGFCRQAAEGCGRAAGESRLVTEQEFEEWMACLDETVCRCPEPVRRAIVLDLERAGIGDRKTLTDLLLLADAVGYQGPAATD